MEQCNRGWFWPLHLASSEGVMESVLWLRIDNSLSRDRSTSCLFDIRPKIDTNKGSYSETKRDPHLPTLQGRRVVADQKPWNRISALPRGSTTLEFWHINRVNMSSNGLSPIFLLFDRNWSLKYHFLFVMISRDSYWSFYLRYNSNRSANYRNSDTERSLASSPVCLSGNHRHPYRKQCSPSSNAWK